MKATDKQIGGNHYSKLRIQPIEYCVANGLGGPELSVIKYVTRWRDKGGLQDLKKAIHVLELLIELDEKYNERGPAPGVYSQEQENGEATQPHGEGYTQPSLPFPTYRYPFCA